jgi:hypothetical protein
MEDAQVAVTVVHLVMAVQVTVAADVVMNVTAAL